MIKHPEGFWKITISPSNLRSSCLQKQKNLQKSIGIGGGILRITKSANSRMTASPLMANPIMPNVFFLVFRKTAAMPSPTPTRFRNRTIRLRVGNRLSNENQDSKICKKKQDIYNANDERSDPHYGLFSFPARRRLVCLKKHTHNHKSEHNHYSTFHNEDISCQLKS